MFAIYFVDSKSYHDGMTLTEYLKTGQKSASQLARELGVAPSMIYQYRKGLRPVPAWRCIKLEEATGGQVTRKSLRPSDWRDIWPELVTINAQSQPQSPIRPESDSTTAD